MLKNQKRNRSRIAVATLTATLLCNIATAQALPNSPACNSLTRAEIKEFRDKVGNEIMGAIHLLEEANREGAAERIRLGGSNAGAANAPGDLRVIADRIDENAFDKPPCKSMFYPLSPEFGPSAGMANPNNIHACFRVDVTPQLEHAMYAATLHAWYNKPGMLSRHSAVKAFKAVRHLLRESREISNHALTCLFESTGDPALGGP